MQQQSLCGTLLVGSALDKGVIAAGAMLLLVASSRLERPDMQMAASQASRRLAGDVQHIKDAMVAAGAVPPLISFLRSDQPSVQEAAAGALRNLSGGS